MFRQANMAPLRVAYLKSITKLYMQLEQQNIIFVV